MSRAAGVARALAILIALAALVDPALRLTRRVPPVLAVLGDSSALDHRITDGYQVVRGPFPAAAATIVRGQTLPRQIGTSARPVFAVRPTARLWIDTVIAPTSLSVDARGELLVRGGVRGSKGSSIEATVASRGVILATTTLRLPSDSGTLSLPLPYTPIGTGPALLDISLHLGRDSARTSVVVDGTDRKWPVLFYDPRPSWQSTFVRRAIEVDSRFVVGGRTNTSRSVGSAVAGSPRSLSDPALLELYDVIAVGAPEGLNSADVAGLETFLRKRGGSVLLLFDEPPTAGAPINRLMSVSRWSSRNRQEPVLLRGADTATLRATEIASPNALPAGATTLANHDGLPVVWNVPVGAGQLVVSGALDAWRYRDPTTSSFDSFWRSTIAGAAASALSPVIISMSHRALRPGEPVDVGVIVREVALSDGTRPISADLTAAVDDSTTVTLWPTARGQFIARLRAPLRAGPHHLAVTANGSQARIDFIVDSARSASTPDERALIQAWSHATGGEVVAPERLAATLDARVQRTQRREVAHLMRSPWWIIPFALLLAFEWWWRRRIGNS